MIFMPIRFNFTFLLSVVLPKRSRLIERVGRPGRKDEEQQGKGL